MICEQRPVPSMTRLFPGERPRRRPPAHLQVPSPSSIDARALTAEAK